MHFATPALNAESYLLWFWDVGNDVSPHCLSFLICKSGAWVRAPAYLSRITHGFWGQESRVSLGTLLNSLQGIRDPICLSVSLSPTIFISQRNIMEHSGRCTYRDCISPVLFCWLPSGSSEFELIVIWKVFCRGLKEERCRWNSSRT